MRRLVILASVVMLAVSSANCANSSEQSNASPVAPSTSGLALRGGGKPGGGSGGSGGSLTYKMVTDNNNDGVANFRETVTFVVQTTATVYPYVTLRCKQNGTLVSQESNGIFPTSLSGDFTLGPTSLWTGGTADCTATLENWDSYSKHGSITVLASTSFTVS